MKPLRNFDVYADASVASVSSTSPNEYNFYACKENCKSDFTYKKQYHG